MKTLREFVDYLQEDLPPKGIEFTKDTDERMYVGASSIGSDCERQVALRLRGYPQDVLTKKLRRIFSVGHKVEDVVVENLLAAIKVNPEIALEDTGPVQHEYTYFGKVCRAHSDGILYFVSDPSKKILVEIKTANDASFSATVRQGIQVAHGEYYDQMQLMMGLGGMKEGLMYMINKNDSRLYTEIINFDHATYYYLLQRIEYIAAGSDEKIAKGPNDWRCSMCSYNVMCWTDKPVPVDRRHCRHCKNAIMTSDETLFATCCSPSVKVDGMTQADASRAKTCNYFEDHRGI